MVRNLPFGVRVGISTALFILALFSLEWSIRKKNDAHPIAWGYMILCFVSIALAILYVAL